MTQPRVERRQTKRSQKPAHEPGRSRSDGLTGLVQLQAALGNQTDFAGEEADKTTESAAGRAIVLFATNIDPDKRVDIMVHLHGWSGRQTDPHAGWRQHKKHGTVRDVDQDRIEGQLQAAGTPQMVAMLPQD